MIIDDCPFCGGMSNIQQIDHDGLTSIYCVHCTKCEAVTTFLAEDVITIGDMVERWNRRAKK